EISWGRFAPYQEHLAQQGDAWDKKAASPEEASLYGRGRNNESLMQQLPMAITMKCASTLVAQFRTMFEAEWHCDCLIHNCFDGGGICVANTYHSKAYAGTCRSCFGDRRFSECPLGRLSGLDD